MRNPPLYCSLIKQEYCKYNFSTVPQYLVNILSSCISRPAHDISLEEFDDEDLSEITDDCGIGLNYDSDPYEKVGPLFILSQLIFYPFISFYL